MYQPRLKPYLKKLNYTYTFGIHPTLELFKHHPSEVLKVLLHSSYPDNDGAVEIKELAESLDIPVEVNDRAIAKIAYKENTFAVGIFEKYETDVHDEKPHVVLVEPRNMGNLGTIIRTMVAFGLYDLVLIGSHADLFDPKVIRSTMGAFFQLRFATYKSIEDYVVRHGDRVNYALMLDREAQTLSDLNLADVTKASIIFGNEGSGLPEDIKKYAQPVYIKQKGDIDSLNLSISVAVTLWHLFGKI